MNLQKLCHLLVGLFKNNNSNLQLNHYSQDFQKVFHKNKQLGPISFCQFTIYPISNKIAHFFAITLLYLFEALITLFEVLKSDMMFNVGKDDNSSCGTILCTNNFVQFTWIAALSLKCVQSNKYQCFPLQGAYVKQNIMALK